MKQIAVDELGLSIDDVRFEYDDSDMPLSPIHGGSYATGVVGSAIKAACKALREELFEKTQEIENSPFELSDLEGVEFRNGKIHKRGVEEPSVSFEQINAHNKGQAIKVEKSKVPNPVKLKQYTRAVTSVAAGRIINPKTARSQILGGMIWGISKAPREETLMDHKLGKSMNPSLEENHIPFHADIHELNVIFVEEKDEIINELGVKELVKSVWHLWLRLLPTLFITLRASISTNSRYILMNLCDFAECTTQLFYHKDTKTQKNIPTFCIFTAIRFELQIVGGSYSIK